MMQLFRCFSLCLLLMCLHTLSAQSEDHAKYISLELAGSGGLGSINYEQDFKDFGKWDLTWRAGFSLAPIDKNNGVGLVFPLMINARFGEGTSKLDMGLGQGVTITTKGAFFMLTTAAVGYRYQKETSPWYFKASYTPLISYLVDFQWQHWGGLSIGYTINTSVK
ncbi:MAG: hypothetical protein K1X40_09340 [Chitinophagales bacterium]|nr:hypothetical protein [Chitinophagales bacterium]